MRTSPGTQCCTAQRFTATCRPGAQPRRVLPERRAAVKRRGEYGPAVCAAWREERTASSPPVERTRRRGLVLGTLLGGLGWGQAGAALAAKKLVVEEVDGATLVLTAEAVAAREAIQLAAQEPDPEVRTPASQRCLAYTYTARKEPEIKVVGGCTTPYLCSLLCSRRVSEATPPTHSADSPAITLTHTHLTHSHTCPGKRRRHCEGSCSTEPGRPLPALSPCE